MRRRTPGGPAVRVRNGRRSIAHPHRAQLDCSGDEWSPDRHGRPQQAATLIVAALGSCPGVEPVTGQSFRIEASSDSLPAAWSTPVVNIAARWPGSGELADEVASVNEAHGAYRMMPVGHEVLEGRSDQAPFQQVGIVAVHLATGIPAGVYHTPADTADGLDPAVLSAATDWTGMLALRMALRVTRPALFVARAILDSWLDRVPETDEEWESFTETMAVVAAPFAALLL